MRKSHGLRPAVPAWLILLVMVMLLCGALSGCGRGSENEEGQGGTADGNPPAGTGQEDSPEAPNYKELGDFLDKKILNWSADPQEADTSKRVITTGNAEDDGGSLFQAYKGYITSKLQTASRELHTAITDGTAPAASEIADQFLKIREKLETCQFLADNLASRLPAPVSATLDPNVAYWQERIVEAEELAAKVSPPVPSPADKDSISEAIEPVLTGVSNIQTDVTSLTDSVDSIRKDFGLTNKLILVVSGLSFLFTIVVLAFVFKVPEKVWDNTPASSSNNSESIPVADIHLIRKSMKEVTDGIDDLKRQVSNIKRNEQEHESHGNAVSGGSVGFSSGINNNNISNRPEVVSLTLSEPPVGGLQNKGVMLRTCSKWDNPQFSAVACGASALDQEYHIWPDSQAQSIVPNLNQNLGKFPQRDIYFSYISKCFDVEPNRPGNYNTYTVQLLKYATVQKNGNIYTLTDRGNVRVQGYN